MIRAIILNHIPFFDTSQHKKARPTSWSQPRRDFFARSIFILPMCRNRHTSSSLGQFLFYRRVRTVTRHRLAKERSVLSLILYAKEDFLLRVDMANFEKNQQDFRVQV